MRVWVRLDCMSIDYINLFKKWNHFTHLHSGKHMKFILFGIFFVVTNYDEHTLYLCSYPCSYPCQGWRGVFFEFWSAPLKILLCARLKASRNIFTLFIYLLLLYDTMHTLKIIKRKLTYRGCWGSGDNNAETFMVNEKIEKVKGTRLSFPRISKSWFKVKQGLKLRKLNNSLIINIHC